MTIRSYVSGKAVRFAESEVAPIHLAEIDGRNYYAFVEKQDVPSGGKIADEDIELIYKHSQPGCHGRHAGRWNHRSRAGNAGACNNHADGHCALP